MKCKFFLFFYIATGFFPALLTGQTYYNISPSKGLSASTVISICKDSIGFMWFGTRNGLNRYDGQSVKTYFHNKDDSGSLSYDDYVFSLLCDAKGNLWVGTKNGLNKYIAATDNFKHYFNSSQPASISDNTITYLFQDERKNIWIGTANGVNLLENNSSDNHFKHFLVSQDKRENFHCLIECIYEDKHGNIWIGTRTGLKKLSFGNDGWLVKNYIINAGGTEPSVKSIVQDQSGVLWIGSDNGNIYTYNVQNDNFLPSKLINLGNQNTFDFLRKMLIDDKGWLWIATIKGLEAYDPASKEHKFEWISQKMQDCSIKDLFQDNQGTIWAGTMYDGVYAINTMSISFNNYHNTNDNSISGNIIGALLPVNNGIWIGTEGKGLNFLDQSTGKFTTYSHSSTDPTTISDDFIKAMIRDSAGNLWIGTYLGGINRFTPKNSKFIHYTHQASDPSSLSSDYVTTLCIDSGGQLWAGSAIGLNVYNKNKDRFEAIDEKKIFGAKLISTFITTICEDSKHNLWIGTTDGINIFSPSERHLYTFTSLTKSNPATNPGFTNCLKQDKDGNMWIGTFREGLYCYNIKNNSFTKYVTADGLPSKNIQSIEIENNGTLWVSTDKGLATFRKKTKHFVSYTISDGLPGNEFNTRSSAIDQHNNLFFGGYKGLVYFASQRYTNTTIPKLVFTDIKVFNKSISFKTNSKILKTNITVAKDITFTHNQNVFTIDFAALNFIHPERNKYAYKLEGFDTKWNYVRKSSATYMNLPAGNYEFLIKGSNNDEIWSKPVKINIHILPPWWQTWWAYCIYVIILGSIIWYAFKVFEKQIQLKNDLFHKKLEAQKKEEQFKIKLDFFTHISHEIRTPLTLITAPLEKILDQTQSGTFIHRQVVSVRKNTDRLLNLVNELLDFRKLEEGYMPLHLQTANFEKFCKTVFSSLRSMAIQHNIEFSFNSYLNEKNTAQFDKAQMEKVLSNLFLNAIKFTPDGGAINVVLQYQDASDKILFHICDTGIGVAPDAEKRIFDEFYQDENNSTHNKGWGIGLAMCKRIIQQHSGQIWLEKEPSLIWASANTCFTFSIPYCIQEGEDTELPDDNENYNNAEDDYINEENYLSAGNSKADSEHLPLLLVVEDNLEMLNFIKESLSNSYQVITAKEGKTGVEMATEFIPDIIISDIAMPTKNGIELCADIKKDIRTSHIPVILLTAGVSVENQLIGLSTGADNYITKPFSVRVLELTISNALAHIKSLQQKFTREIQFAPIVEEEIADENNTSLDTFFVEKIKSIIEEYMEDTELSVIFLAQKMGMSRTVLFKKIKALTGLNIQNLIKSVRLHKAAQLLQVGSAQNVTDIAYKTGFNDPKYFGKEFKKQFGVSPSEYSRKK